MKNNIEITEVKMSDWIRKMLKVNFKIVNAQDESRSVSKNEDQKKVCSCIDKSFYYLGVEKCVDCGKLHIKKQTD